MQRSVAGVMQRSVAGVVQPSVAGVMQRSVAGESAHRRPCGTQLWKGMGVASGLASGSSE